MQKFSSKVIMDASASPKANADINEVYGLLLTAIDNNKVPTPMNQRSTIIKYTKLPDFDVESRAKDRRPPTKTSNRAVGNDFKEEKPPSHRTTSRLTSSPKYSKDIKSSTKTNNGYKKEVNITKQNYRSKQIHNPPPENTKTRCVKEKDVIRHPKSSSISSRSSISKNLGTPSESERDLSIIKNKLYPNLKSKDTFNKAERTKQVYPPPPNKNKKMYFKECQNKSQPLTIIHVPLDEKYKKHCAEEPNVPRITLEPLAIELKNKIDRGTDPDQVVDYKNIDTGTDPLPKTVDQVTDMDDYEIKTICQCIESTVPTQSFKETYDNLEIPNVTLTKDKTENKNDLLNSISLPNLKIQTVKFSPHKEEFNDSDIRFCENASYIISRATLTYTTRQKINLVIGDHVVGNNERSVRAKQPPSPLAYPMNVVSVFKNEFSTERKDVTMADKQQEKENNANTNITDCLNERKSLNCSYIFNSTKLMKPSDIISTIGVNNGLLQSDCICEQFQRELNFIDSFFESLQYLESCSLSDKCFADDKVENFVHNSALFDSGFDVKNSDYDNFLSKIENGASTDDAETMASKSLCLLNLLIRDEQRRAKNLLFVLKMREDALKDFTKSQILWLEKKKKHDNTDISTLKKKQRGALLKLQHECGEMQRMRKALLTLSEKRKVALMKTKKNIELKLKNNVDVEQFIFGKKKLKRNIPCDRNAAPLKCFDLSSSGCEDSTTSRPHSEVAVLPPEALASLASVTCAEKCVQTVDSVLGTVLMDPATNTAAENFVVVDGGYLNILFHNLMLPQIFSNGKQYEVNEEALKNILNSANNNNFNGCDIVEKLMEQIENRNLDRSSSPSTARSLVDEFDQYYKGLAEEDKSPYDLPEKSPDKVREIKDIFVQTPEISIQSKECRHSISTMTNNSANDSTDRSCGCESLGHVGSHCQTEQEHVAATSQTQTGPLPVPVGEAASPESPPPDIPEWLPVKSSDSTSTSESFSSRPLYGGSSISISSLASPVQSEAEELRRQQLAIEREIKALEQQQCRLLVVREIPDKPPPPYTPPAEPRPQKLPRMFTPDHASEEKIEKHIINPENDELFDLTDPFDAFLKDFCEETLERHTKEQSDMPWDACNLLPQKQQVDNQKLSQKTSMELKEILTGAIPAVVSGFSNRRSDHIDDILFAEWRRCEPEWTNLHTDEAIVKNQLFESIFQKILSETIDEYRRTVQCKTVTD